MMNIIYSNTLHVHNHRFITNFNGRVTTSCSCSRRRASVLARNSSSASTAPELSPSNAPPTPNILLSSAGKPEADVIVIGSGIGGLCCAGLLARYEKDVLVLESHDLPGGAAHSFDIKGYKFDSGPSLFSGLQSRGLQANPLAQVLDALGEPIPCVKYDSWKVYVPEGEFLSRIGPTEFFKDLEKYAGPDAVREWRKLLDAILPMSTAAMALPPVSIRGDWGVLSTAAARYAPTLLKSFAQMGPRGALGATKLLRPFSEIVDSLELKDPFIRNWVDLLSFLLAGVKSDGILSAEMVYMFAEWYKPNCTLEYPLQGSGAIVDALVRGLQKFGGRISLRSHVETIVVENGRAIGVKLRTGQFVRARKAVVSNASMWDTLNLLPKEVVPKSYQDRIENIPQCESFMHLHLGFDSEVTWNSVERAIGSGFTREKCEVKLVGTPLTSKRFLRKNRGTYGPAIQAGKDTNANPATKITKNKSNGVPKNEPKITIPTMYDIIASSKQQKVELKLQTLGPFFRITAKRLESNEEIGRADGIIRVWFGGKILHLDSIKLSRETLGMEKSIFGIGVFLGAVAIRYGYDCGCTSAELLAINDSDLYHKKLVRFYTRIGFKKVYEVTGSSVGDYSHMLVWGGVGTRMEANVQHLLVKWCTRFIPRK